MINFRTTLHDANMQGLLDNGEQPSGFVKQVFPLLQFKVGDGKDIDLYYKHSQSCKNYLKNETFCLLISARQINGLVSLLNYTTNYKISCKKGESN